jgi:hypothetical protein
MAHPRDKNRIFGPTDIHWPTFVLQGIPMPVIADLPEGGFVNWIHGDNPIGIPMPGCHLVPGSMVVMLPPDLVQHIRKEILDAWDKAVTVNLEA